MKTLLRTAIVAAASVIIAAACGEPTGPSGFARDYRATHANTLVLPALIFPTLVPSDYTGFRLSLVAGRLTLVSDDSLTIVLHFSGSDGSAPSDTIRARYTMRGDTIDVPRSAQRGGNSAVVAPIVRGEFRSLRVPAAHYRSMSMGFVEIPMEIIFRPL